MALVKRQVTVTVVHPDDQTPCTGTVRYKPGAGPLIDPVDGRILAGCTPDLALDETGSATIDLATTDQAGIQPEPDTWNWTVEFNLADAALAPFSFALPTDDGSPVNLAAYARQAPTPGTYRIIPGPPGPKGDKGDPGDVGGGALIATNNLTDLPDKPAARTALGLGTAATHPAGDFDPAGAATTAAGTAQTNAISAAANDATNKVTAHTAANDPHGDRAWATSQFDPAGAATTAAAGALTTAKTYADDGDTSTLNAAKAYTDTHTGGGGTGTVIGTPADDRIDIGIITLTPATTWTKVTTPGGTPVQNQVAATAGDRILVSLDLMYTGTQYNLDYAIMKGDGSGPSRFASSSGTSTTPGPEGYAPLYTQAASFPHASGTRLYTVTADEIDPTGNVTIALYYIAPSLSGTDQKVYVGSGYLAAILPLNIGPAA